MKLRSRGQTYAMLTGILVGMLAMGLAIPFALGERPADRASVAAGGRATPAPTPGDTPGATPGLVAGGPAPGAPDGQLPAGGAPSATVASGPAGNGAAGTAPSPAAGGQGDPSRPSATTSPTLPEPPPQQPGGAELQASDRGVTAESIKVGIMLLNVAGASDFGVKIEGADPEAQRVAWDAWIGETNDRGGILGRTIDPYFREYDILSEDDMRAACLAATQDEKVFAVLDAAALSYPSALCITEENDTPFYSLGSNGMPVGAYERAKGLMFTAFESGVRAMANYVGQLHEGGYLTGKTIGILMTASPGAKETVDAGAVQTLQSLGYAVDYTYELSPDLNTSASQIPLAVQQMQSRGVDAVLLLTAGLNASQFVQNAEKRAYFPSYFVSDWGTGYSDTYVSNMPQSFEGNIVITSNRTGEFRQDRPEPAPDADCRERYERHSGTQLDRSTIDYNFSLRGCMLWDIFEASAAKAGTNLTRRGLVDATQQLGPVPTPTFGGGSFGPGKFDAADQWRAAQFIYDCRCWMPLTEFQPGRF